MKVVPEPVMALNLISTFICIINFIMINETNILPHILNKIIRWYLFNTSSLSRENPERMCIFIKETLTRITEIISAILLKLDKVQKGMLISLHCAN